MTESTHAKVPIHLRKYIVDQNYARYTPEDQAVWRYIMRQLKSFLTKHAHESYLSGLEKTGISVDRIPNIESIDQHLERFGWGAVPVSGFIPPAAFMEFQAIGVLPIASDMRTLAHLQYTPAPDIVHEAAGHAPILVHPEYATYLRQYGEVARHSIISKEDMDQYEAIRILSDIKEDPRSSVEEITRAEKRLNEINASMRGVSEAALLSRMNWWTAEYGLIGDIKQPRIFGAGLLSSVGESRECLDPKVKKIPLTVDCVNFTYDITEPQPQLFVTDSFAHLGEVLEQLAVQLAYRRGGVFGLARAREAATVNTAQLDSGLQVSGVLKSFVLTADGLPAYLQFDGPSQLSFEYEQLDGHGTARHPHGFSCPLGLLAGEESSPYLMTTLDLDRLGIRRGEKARLQFQSGVVVEGYVKDWLYKGRTLLLITWRDCKVTLGSKLLFDPAWGEYDMAVGAEVESVFGGPADRSHYGQANEDFAARLVPAKTFPSAERKRHAMFQDLRNLRERNKPGAGSVTEFRKLVKDFMSTSTEEWLPGVELLELSYTLGLPDSERTELRTRLNPDHFASETTRQSVADGVELAERRL
ncbi:MAG: aromatic amino acid hydroxylase [Bdellovibrionales bacterium]|nr:aromatic amino acid hydroxylase [Bdellovibrionales bacterium]